MYIFVCELDTLESMHGGKQCGTLYMYTHNYIHTYKTSIFITQHDMCVHLFKRPLKMGLDVCTQSVRVGRCICTHKYLHIKHVHIACIL